MASNVLEIIIKATDKASGELKQIDKSISELGKTSGKAGGGFDELKTKMMSGLATFGAVSAAAVGVGIAVKKAFDFAKAGASITQTAESFDLLLEKVGAAPDLLDQLDKASLGTISKFDLMTSTATLLAGAQGDLATALANSTPKLLEIAKAANKLNPALGDTNFQYQSLALGIKRASPMILDNLGLTLKIGDANEKYAKQLGKTVEQLTAEEQKMALLNATLDAGNVLIEQVGGNVEAAGDKFAQMEANISNLTDNVKVLTYEALGPLVGTLAEVSNAAVENSESSHLASFGLQEWIGYLFQGKTQTELFTQAVINGSASLSSEELALQNSGAAFQDYTTYSLKAADASLGIGMAAGTAAGELTGLKSAIDGVSSSSITADQAMQKFTDQLVFNAAAAGLDEEGQLALAQALGLVDNRTVQLYEELPKLNREYDRNADGAINAGAETLEYAAAVARLRDSINSLKNKTVYVDVKIKGGGVNIQGGQYTVSGSGGQHGLDMMVPPGFPNDTYPIRATSGERVVIIPKGLAGNTYNTSYNLNVNSQMQSQGIVSDFALLQALAGG